MQFYCENGPLSLQISLSSNNLSDSLRFYDLQSGIQLYHSQASHSGNYFHTNFWSLYRDQLIVS